MFKRTLSLVVIMVVGLCGFAQAQDLIEVFDEQVWNNFAEGGFSANDTLQILNGGSLTVNGRSAVKDGMHLIVEEGGKFIMNGRMDTDSQGVITMNGGEFYSNVDFKFPDSSGQQDVHIWLHGGLMVFNKVESRAERGSTLHVGGGVLRTGEVSSDSRADPSSADWNIVPIPPYANVVITELEGDVKEVSASGALIQISDEQTWDNFEAGGFGANGKLQILAGGNLTVNGRSAIKDGMQLTVEEGGIFTMNDRLDTDSQGQIIMNGGEFYSNMDFKFPDSSGQQDVHIWLYGGLMVFNKVESRAERGSTLHVGGGVLRTGEVSSDSRADPSSADWNIVAIYPYSVVITELEGDVKEVSASGDLIQISDQQVWKDFAEGGFEAGDTLQILDGGTLDVNDRSAIKDGMHLIVEKGGVFNMNGRLDTDSEGVITMNGGEFHSNVDFKFPDSSGQQDVHIWLDSGLMVFNKVESRADRGSTLHVGGGMLRTGETSGGGRADPGSADWNIEVIEPNDILIITELQDDFKMVSAARELIQISDEQTWKDFEEGGFDDGDTLEILAGGSLTVNERSGITDGRCLIVEAGGVFTMNDRLDMDSQGQIIVNGGEFYSNVDLKFPDSSGNQDVDIWLDAGLMVCNKLESRADRGSTLHVGGGILQTGEAFDGTREDPSNAEEWNIVPIPPYTSIVITLLENDVKEVTASL
ncbi:MAG: hypothetical protein ACYTBX_03630 [Planctomycetota bacterium]